MDRLSQSKWACWRNVALVLVHRVRVYVSQVRTDLFIASRGVFLPNRVEIAGALHELTRLDFPATVGVQRDVTVFLVANSPGRLRIGPDVFIGRGSFFTVHGDLTVGCNVMIGPYCYITSATHISSDLDKPMAMQGMVGQSVIIDDDVWIGTGVTVLPGVQIGKGSIVGAGSVVTKSIGNHEVWAGVPALKLRDR